MPVTRRVTAANRLEKAGVTTTMILQSHDARIDRDGFTIVREVLSADEVERWIRELDELFATGDATIKDRKGAVYAARNFLASLPECCNVAKYSQLTNLLTKTLSPKFGLVRGLYFDKHPDRTWSLTWHKDLTIAVKDNSIPSVQFTKPTNKSGIAHVEAPEHVLKQMLTLRFHLDPVTDANGPLEVAVGSHANGKRPDTQHTVQKILVNAGDVLAMRPLLSHASGSSASETRLHRRILHLEFAAELELADGFQWHTFIR